ncbi:hypothetical protein L484_015489 [Morus notabilis]|uniref:Bifunctional inhibitor/plant lipid transfer protein/seed storage helical domain-containing protein n=1 Tax=Morus notabilis TaxID=981085 RepID=W9RIS8_9ROSA|nr:non-specific lipid transfer protein GPI-anchored 1 [Morus notabilis]EXB93945.1 hypothetical protein L484_015489 [Morus notabilis]
MKMLVVVVAAALLVVVFLGSHEVAAAAASTQEKCGADFQKLAVCLTYATGKAAVPTKDCCDLVKGIKESEPECLCLIMQQTHKGNDQIKNMGIQESKLLSLPTACALKNATLAECPKLLGLPANSPDAAIFTNASTASATPTAKGTGASQSQTSKDSSSGARLGTHLASLPAMAMAVTAIAFFAYFLE